MPIIKGTTSTSPIYKGADKIGKIFKGIDLIYQSGPELPTMQVYVRRLEFNGNGTPNNQIGDYVAIYIGNLASGEIITITYGNITKEVSTNGYVFFGRVDGPINASPTYGSGVDDGAPTEGWITIKSNTIDSTAVVQLSSAYTYGQQASSSYSCIADGTFKGNYVFSKVLSFLYATGGNVYGTIPETVTFATAKRYAPNIIFSTSEDPSNLNETFTTTQNIILGNNTEYIADYAFGKEKGSVDFKNITFENKNNKFIDISVNAFKVKTASSYNVYTYGNDSVMNYDWATANSGAIINNLG